MKKTLSVSIFLSLLLFFAITGCRTSDSDEAPELPPLSSFIMDFSDFIPDETPKMTLDNTHLNRNQAIVHIAVWNIITFVHMAVPVATFMEAFNHNPTEQSDGSWLWSYDVQVGLSTYTAKLYGKVSGIEVEWHMYVSKTGAGGFSDFLWYSGTSHIAGVEGSWTINKMPTEPVPYVGIDWSTNSNGTAVTTYTNIVPDGPENGGYISHGTTQDVPYNAFYHIYNKGLDNLVEIEWNRITKAGRIRNPHHYGNSDFHCWNAMGVDIDCP